MRNLPRKLWTGMQPSAIHGLHVACPLVLLQSDDWGRVGVQDRAGFEQLQSCGIDLGANPYDVYTLETAEDLAALSELLRRHHDSSGRSPCMTMNFIMANLDFPKIAQDNYQDLHLMPLTGGLPGEWSRPGLFEAYQQGIDEGLFYPAMHGLTHFCSAAMKDVLRGEDERTELLRTLWKAQTPYIYWRMPWVGYEYCRPSNKGETFLESGMQDDLMQEAAKIFQRLFGMSPFSACAPGYRSNMATHQSWANCGVRVAQKGTGATRPPYIDDYGILNLFRSIDFEPSQGQLSQDACLEQAAHSFDAGYPFVVSIHSINFHSSVKDFRSSTLSALENLLTALETKYPDLLYVHDRDFYEIVTRGRFAAQEGIVTILGHEKPWSNS